MISAGHTDEAPPPGTQGAMQLTFRKLGCDYYPFHRPGDPTAVHISFKLYTLYLLCFRALIQIHTTVYKSFDKKSLMLAKAAFS